VVVAHVVLSARIPISQKILRILDEKIRYPIRSHLALREDDTEYLKETIYPGLSVRSRESRYLQAIRQLTKIKENTRRISI